MLELTVDVTGAASRLLGEALPPPPPPPPPASHTPPPADWRMPATVATSPGFASQQSALTAANSAADNKSRPLLAIPANGTEYVEWTVQEDGDALLSFVFQSDSQPGGASVSLNGVDQGFTLRSPDGADANNRRQAIVLAVAAGDTIRLTVTSTRTNEFLRPLLHKKPATGPWDAHVVIGASREVGAHRSVGIEDQVIADYPGRDPIILNYARGGAGVGNIATTYAPAAASHYAGVAQYAMIGSLIGNDVSSNRPYDPAQKATLDADIGAIYTALDNAGMQVCLGTTSYRAYTDAPAVTPQDQSGGSLPYNQNVIAPFVQANMSDTYDAAIGTGRVDEYLLTLLHRALLADQVHGTSAQYALVRQLWSDTWFRYVYTGDWPDSQIEQRTKLAEDSGETGPNRVLGYQEGIFALDAILAGPEKTAITNRLEAVRQEVYLQAADEAVTQAEASQSQVDIDAAQAKVDAAAAQGNDVTTLQARLDAIDSGSTVTALIRHGSTSAVAGWNAIDEGTSTGTMLADILDSEGNATGWSYIVDAPFSGKSNNGALVSGVAWIPDAVLSATTWRNGGAPATWRFTGLNNAKVYDIDVLSCRAGGGNRNAVITIDGEAQPQVNAANNVSELRTRTGIAPVDGVIDMAITLGSPNNAFAYITATRITERDS